MVLHKLLTYFQAVRNYTPHAYLVKQCQK